MVFHSVLSRYRVSNLGREPRQVAIEPWGDTHLLQPGETLEVRGASPLAGRLSVDQSGDIWAVWAWVGSTARAFIGDRLLDHYSIPVPPIP